MSRLPKTPPNPNNNGFEALEAFVIGSDGNLHHIWQLGSWKGWSGWGDSLGAPPGGIAAPTTVGDFPQLYPGPLVARNADGRLDVFVVESRNYVIWHRYQNAPNSGWSDWQRLGLLVITPPFQKPSENMPFSVLLNPNQPPSIAVASGGLTVFVLGPDGNVWSLSQTAPFGVWGPLLTPG
jgi:hypothetical protein